MIEQDEVFLHPSYQNTFVSVHVYACANAEAKPDRFFFFSFYDRYLYNKIVPEAFHKYPKILVSVSAEAQRKAPLTLESRQRKS